MGLMLDICRNISVADRKSQADEFASIAPAEMTGIELTGKTLGLIGAGNIARIVGKILVGGFDCNVVAYDPYMPAEAMESFGYKKIETVDDVGKLRAAACDAFVSEPSTANNTSLYELDNFIGTPHIGAGTEEALVRMGEESVANVITVLEGGEPARRVV